MAYGPLTKRKWAFVALCLLVLGVGCLVCAYALTGPAPLNTYGLLVSATDCAETCSNQCQFLAQLTVSFSWNNETYLQTFDLSTTNNVCGSTCCHSLVGQYVFILVQLINGTPTAYDISVVAPLPQLDYWTGFLSAACVLTFIATCMSVYILNDRCERCRNRAIEYEPLGMP